MSRSPGGAPRPLLTLLLAALALGGLNGGCRKPPGPERPPDLLVVTIDTARADRFSYRGDSPVTTSFVDRIASEGTAFLEAISPAPITLVAHASLFTGQNPPTHGVRDNGTYRLADSAITLAELLEGNAYATAAFIGAAVLDVKYGLSQGFGHYDDRTASGAHDHAGYGAFEYASRTGEVVVDAALEWLEDADDRSFFMWVHLWDPHAPYMPPEPERTRFAAAPYDGEIAYADRMVGRLVDGLKKRRRYDGTIVVITADHGEMLGEHGESTHAVFVYESAIRVPLVIRAPGLGAGRRVAEQVGLIDVLPTILSLLRVDPPPGLEGRDLTPLMRGEATPDPGGALYLESRFPLLHYGWTPFSGIRTLEWKLVEGKETELYDLLSDPGEARDLSARQPDRVRELARSLDRLETPSTVLASERVLLDDRTRDRLRSLGYVWSGGAAEENANEDRPDARRAIRLLPRLQRARDRFSAGMYAMAIEEFREVLEEDPGNLVAGRRLVKMLLATGRFGEALKAGGRVVAAGGGDADDLVDRALALERLGRIDEAVTAYESAAQGDPNRPEILWRKWRLLLDRGRTAGLEADVDRAFQRGVGVEAAQAILALYGSSRSDREERAAALRRDLSEAPGNPYLRYCLADVLLESGDVTGAAEHYSRALDAGITLEAARTGLARALLASGDHVRARETLAGSGMAMSSSVELFALLARAHHESGDRAGAVSALRRASMLSGGGSRELIASWLTPGETLEASTCATAAELLADGGLWREAAGVLEIGSRLGADAAVLRELGEAWESAGDPGRALAAYARALALDPDDAEAREGRWRVLGAQGRAAEVEGEARRYLEGDRSDAPARIAIARSGIPEGDRLAAVGAFEQLLGETPGDRQVVLSLADLLATGGATDRTRAERLYRSVLEEDPRSQKAASALGRILLEKGDTRSALSFLEAALVPRSDATLRTLLGQARARRGDTAGALRILREAVKLDPGDPEIWFTTGNVQLAGGGSVAAAESYQRALALGLDDAAVRENLRRASEGLDLQDRVRLGLERDVSPGR